MADGVNININKATLNAKSLEGIGLTPLGDEKKKLFKKDEQSELMKALAEMPESFRTVLKQTMESTGQTLLKDFFSKENKEDNEEPKEDFAKPTDKINDVKKLAAKYGTPTLFLGSKIDDIIEILRKPVKDTAEVSRNSPISAASVIVLGSNVEDSKKYIKDFQELTDFVANQKSIDIGVFKDTQKKLDELSTSMQKTTRQKVDDKSAETFSKKMGNITTSFGGIVKQVITLNILTKNIDFKNANKKLNDLDNYLERLGRMGENLAIFTESIVSASKGAFKIILYSPIFKLATKKIQSIKEFITDGIKPLLDKMDDLGSDILKKTKRLNESFKNILSITATLLKVSLVFSVLTPFALLGRLGLAASDLFLKGLSKFVDYIADNFELKKIQKGMRAVKAILLLVALTSASMLISSLVVPIALKALVGAVAIGLFAVGMGFALNMMGKMTDKIAQGLLAAALTTVFAALAFISLKALSTITPPLVGTALIAVLGFLAVMAVTALIGVAAMYIMAPLALGIAAATLTTVFALATFLALKVLGKIELESIQKAISIMIGSSDGPGLILLYASMAPLALVGPAALLAMATAMPAAVMLAVFAICTKKSIEALSTIENESIKLASKNIVLMNLPFASTALVAPSAILAMTSLPPIISAISLLTMAALPFKLLVKLLGNEPFYTEKNPLLARSGILGFVNTMTLTMGLLGLTALIAPLAVFGATALSTVMLVLVPALLIFSKISKFFSKKADPNLVDIIYGDNLDKPLKSKYGLIAFLNGAVIAAKTICGGTIHFLLGSISAILMGLFFSSLKKSLDAMDQLAAAAKNGIDNEAIQSYLETMERVATGASSPGLLRSLGEAVNSWVANKLGTSTADLINQMTQSVSPLRRLSNQLQGINLDGISIFLDAMDKLQKMQKAPNIKAIRGTIDGLNEIAESMNIDGEKFNANIDSIMPGVEKLQKIPDGTGLTKKAKEIKSAISTIFSAKTGKDADELVNKINRLTDSLERLSKVDSNNISKTLGISGGISYKETSSSTLGAESSKRNNSTNVNIDNKNLESLLERILTAIEDLKQTKTWADEPQSYSLR